MNQYTPETPAQFAERELLQRCRAKCAREFPPTRTRPRATLTLRSAHYSRPEGVAVPKVETPRDKRFLQWLLTRPCELRGGQHGPCFGDMIYHHTESGGVALKGSDYAAISVCFGHHELFDSASKRGVGIFREGELAAIIARNMAEWVGLGNALKEGR